MELLLDRYRESLTLFLYSIVGNLEDAEDLMIDSFAEAAAKQSWSPEGSSFKTWLFSVGKHLAGKHYRWLKRHRIATEPLEDFLEAQEDCSPEFLLLQQEQYRNLYFAMDRLSPDYRQILYLLYFEGMSSEESGIVMHKTPGQIYVLANRARKSLRKELGRMGIDYA